MEFPVKLIDKILSNRLLTHILFWILVSLLLYTFFVSFAYESFKVYLVNLIAILPPQIILSYTLIYFLIPKYIFKKKYVTFIILFILLLYFCTCISRFLTIYVVEDINQRGYEKESLWQIITQYKVLLGRYSFIVFIAPLLMLPFKLIKDRFEERSQIEELKKEKVAAELNFLKAQIHPHFLFNTLNNLYLLTLEKSDQAPGLVIKLSEILDYILYKCNAEYVPLNSEVQLLNNYIELEKLRNGAGLSIEFKVNVDSEDYKIAPLILLTLVENAFKHGVNRDPNNPQVNIVLNVENGKLTFKVENTIPTESVSRMGAGKEGIGLKNMKRQLELSYNKEYSLSQKVIDNFYKTQLIINL